MDRLKKRTEFVEVAKGARLHRSAFSLQARPQRVACSGARVGFTVTKKTGNSVERNRIRRRLKAAVADVQASISTDIANAGIAKPGDAGADLSVDYVLIGRRLALSLPYDDLCQDLRTAFCTIDPTRRSKSRRSKNQRANDRVSNNPDSSDRGSNPAARPAANHTRG